MSKSTLTHHSRQTRPVLRRAVCALTSLCASGLVALPAFAQQQTPVPTRPLIPLVGEGAVNSGFTSVRLTPQEVAGLLTGMAQRDRLPAYSPQFGGGGAVLSRGFGTRALPAIINSNRNWVGTGPVNVDPPYTAGLGSFPMAGRVNQIVWDPVRRDANGRPNILYIATASGGLWRATIDYGLEFSAQPAKRITDPLLKTGIQPLSDFAFPTLATSCVAVHPTNSRIVYVGTGDFDGDAISSTGTGVGIMKTVNDGRTWVKIGDRSPGTGAAIMEGASVSALVIDPNNSRRLLAASGRGATPGSLWLSEDEGNTWRRPNFVDANGNAIPVPTGDWSSIDYSAAKSDRTRTRTWYATRIGDGLYRSDDSGSTWRRLNNLPLELNGRRAGGWGLEVAASKVASGTDIVYVMDAASSIASGFIFKSTDRGTTWIQINGDYPYQTGFGNWATAYAASHLFTGVLPVNVYDNGTQIGDTSFARDVLFGGSRWLSVSESIGVRTTLTGQIFGGGLDVGVGSAWTNLTELYGTFNDHLDQHSVAQRPGNVSGGEAYFATSSQGGVYGLNYQAGAVDATGFFPGTWNWDYRLDLNSNLTVQPIVDGDFYLTASGQMRFIGGSNYLGAPRMQTFLDESSTDVDWDTVPFSNNPPTVNGVRLDDTNTAPPQGATTFTRTLSGAYPTNIPGNYVSTATFDPADPSGNTSYLMVNGGENWPDKRLYYTFDNWITALDISPDRYRVANPSPFGLRITTPDYANGIFVYRSTDPQDTGTQSNWAGNTKPAFGQKTAMAVVGQRLLVGTSALWRFDPPGVWGALPGVTAPATYPNKDLGQWRRVGNGNVTANGYITAITALNLRNIYVGTSTGEIYFTDRATDQDTSTPIPNLTGAWRRLNTPTEWAGRPVTSISYNPDPTNNNIGFYDLIVTLGGNPNGTPVARVWRNPNTLATTASVFTPVSGQGAVALPDVSHNAITRDADDPYNTWFVATDVGVFATDNGGSTWSNATAPLGLPNVKVVAAEVVQRPGVANNKWLMVATNGRGVWRFNLNGLVNQITDPDIRTEVTINRINGELVSTISVTNNGGAAYDVRLTPGATAIVVNGAAQISSSFPVVNGVAQPLTLGTVGKGQTQTVTLRYSGAAPLRPGTLVTYRIGGTFVKPPLPPGTPGTFSNSGGKLLRLP